MNSHWRDVAREATAAPPPGAKERVWRAMQEPRPARRPLWLAVPAAALVALLMLMAWPRGESRTWTTSGSVVALQGARTSFDPAKNRLQLETGTVAASVWAEPALEILVKGHSVEVEAADLVVKVAGDSLIIAPTKGWVLVDGVRVDATQATRAQVGAELAVLAPHLPADVANRQASRRVELALAARQWERAVQALDEVGRSGTLSAEAAVLRKGELELRQLQDPARALSTFDDAAARFPAGSLAQERELSALEAEVALERWPQSATRAERFLRQFPRSERQDDVRALQAGALFKLGRRDEACASVLALPDSRRGAYAHVCDFTAGKLLK